MNFKENDRIIYQPVGGALQTSTGIIKRIIPQSIQHNEKKLRLKMNFMLLKMITLIKKLPINEIALLD